MIDQAMLIKFHTAAAADIVMFGDVGMTLIELMGHSGAVPSALLAADIPQAYTKLQAAVAANPQRPLNPVHEQDSSVQESDHVTLSRRALPLLQLLAAAMARDKPVMWDWI
jgi:hypothetical protein